MELHEFLEKVNNNDLGVTVKAIIGWDEENVIWYRLQAQDDRTIEVEKQEDVEPALEQFRVEPEEVKEPEEVEETTEEVEEDLPSNEE